MSGAFEPTADETRGERAAHAIYGLIIVLAILVVEADTAIDAREAIGTASAPRS